MNRLHIITGLNTGGAQRVLHRVLAHGKAGSGRVTVISLSDEGTYGPRIRALGVAVHALGMRRGLPGPVALARLYALVRKTRPGIIQGWMYHGNLAAWLARRVAPGRPALAWNIRHSLSDPFTEKPLTRRVLHWSRRLSGAPDALVYNSQRAREQHEAFGFRPGRARVIPNGFDPADPPDPDTVAAVRASVKLPGDALVVGHVARLHPMKDHGRFVRAAVRVAQARDDVYVLLIGQGVTGSNEALTSLVPGELSSRFQWLGERKDARELMGAMDVLCLSSAWGEACPNVLGEAMARGVPCVATDVGDSAAIIGETGRVVAPRDEEALFTGLMSLLDRTPDKRRALGLAARQRIESSFGLEAMLHRYDALERQLFEARSDSPRTPAGPS